MKKIIFFLTAIIIGVNLQAQDTDSRKEQKAERKAIETAKRDSLRTVQESWVKDKTYVLEAQQVYNKIGEVFQMTPSTNFVYLDGENAIVQLSFNGLIGWNGVGGITIKGRITKYEFDDSNKNKPIYIRMTIQGSEGFHDIVLWVSNSGMGEAQVTDIRGNLIKFTGDIVSLSNTRVFIGSERF